MHHAIAIPEGEGRYILNRLTGDITTIVGPQMYLPDPRTEVVVKRKLSEKECELFYPGNKEVLEYNNALTEKQVEQLARKGLTTDKGLANVINSTYSTANQASTLAIFEANANISRGVSYTKPRTITLDTKYEGVVGINVWTGYAVNIVDKKGNRQIVIGPATKLLNYDETLESVNGGGNKSTAYLKIKNNSVSSSIDAKTKDHIDVTVHVSYNIDFLEEFKNKWFNIENYSEHAKNIIRNLLKKEIKKYTIHEFYENAQNIITSIISGNEKNSSKDKSYRGKLFKENGMIVTDIEIHNVVIDENVSYVLEQHRLDLIHKTIQLQDAENKIKLIEAIAEADKKEAETNNAKAIYDIELRHNIATEKLNKEQELEAKKQIASQAKADAELELQSVLSQINEAQIAREKANQEAKIALQKELAAIEEAKQKAYAETIKEIVGSITPDLVAALSTKANAELLTEATKNMSPLAIAKGESVADTLNTLLRGTTLEKVVEKIGE
jgi:major vault protein